MIDTHVVTDSHWSDTWKWTKPLFEWVWLQEHWSVMCRCSVVSHNNCVRHTDGIATSHRISHFEGISQRHTLITSNKKYKMGKLYNIPTPTAITALYAHNIIWNGETTSFWTFPKYAHNTYLDHSHTLSFSYWTHYKQWRLSEFVRLSCAFIIRVDSKASLTAAVIMLGSIKHSECSPYCW